MYVFLFDVESNTGHIRITLQLAFWLQEKGHEVYYTDSSDSEFTSELLQKGIGRIIYPDDLCWFTPDLVLLDCQLTWKAAHYRERKIAYIYVTTYLLGFPLAIKDGVPVFSLSPFYYGVKQVSIRQTYWTSRLAEIKKKTDSVVIAGFLEGEVDLKGLSRFFVVLKELCLENKDYHLVLLNNTSQEFRQLFPLPENISVFRQLDFSSLLPVCDVALTTGELNILIECIYAKCPFLYYPLWRKEGYDYVARATWLGLGSFRNARKVTMQEFKQDLKEIFSHLKEIKESAGQLCRLFDRDNENIGQNAARLIAFIEKKIE